MFEEYKEVLTVAEVCTALSMGKNTVYGLLKKKLIKAIQIRKKYYIPKQFLIDFIEMYK